jgi:hypothetical protein
VCVAFVLRFQEFYFKAKLVCEDAHGLRFSRTEKPLLPEDTRSGKKKWKEKNTPKELLGILKILLNYHYNQRENAKSRGNIKKFVWCALE